MTFTKSVFIKNFQNALNIKRELNHRRKNITKTITEDEEIIIQVLSAKLTPFFEKKKVTPFDCKESQKFLRINFPKLSRKLS